MSARRRNATCEVNRVQASQMRTCKRNRMRWGMDKRRSIPPEISLVASLQVRRKITGRVLYPAPAEPPWNHVRSRQARRLIRAR